MTDLEIDYMNKKRNINLELSEEEKLLYTYSQGITMKLLEEMKNKYQEQNNAPATMSDPFNEASEDLLDEMPTLTRT